MKATPLLGSASAYVDPTLVETRPAPASSGATAAAKPPPQVPRPRDLKTQVSASDPTAQRIIDATGAALQRGPVQLRVSGHDSWPDTLVGTVKRRIDKKTDTVVATFTPAGAPNDGSGIVTLTPEQAAGIASNARVTLVRDRVGSWHVAALEPGDPAQLHGMVARVERRGSELWAVPTSRLSGWPAMPLREAGDAEVGDLMLAEVKVAGDGKRFATISADPRWHKIDADRAAALSIVVDEAGVDVAIPDEVRAEATAVLAQKPMTTEAIVAAGYRDLTGLEFYTTDNPDKPGGGQSHDFDQAVALEPRPGGGYVVYRAISDPAYFFDFFPEDGKPSATVTRALGRTLTAYFHPDDAPIYDRRFCEGAMSLNAGEARPSFVVKLEVDANGRTVVDENGQPRVELLNAAIRVRHNGNYWDSHRYLNGEATNLPAGYRAFWDAAKRLADTAGVRPRDSEDLDSKAIESYFSKLANSIITSEIERLLRANALYDAAGAKYVSRFQAPPEPERIDAYFGLVKALGLEVPPPPALSKLTHAIGPNDDRWPALVDALGLDTAAPTSRVFDALAEVVRDPAHARASAVTEALWTPREQIRALIAEQDLDPQMQDILSYNYVRRLHRAVVSSKEDGHFDVGLRRYGWVTAPMRRTVDVVNQCLWRALAAGDLSRARRILAALPGVTSQHERASKSVEFAGREIERRKIARVLQPEIGKGHLDGVVRHISLEGVELSLTSPAANVLVPMKWIAKRLGETPKPSPDGDALLVDGRIVVAVAQPVRARVDSADPESRKIYLDLEELGPEQR